MGAGEGAGIFAAEASGSRMIETPLSIVTSITSPSTTSIRAICIRRLLGRINEALRGQGVMKGI